MIHVVIDQLFELVIGQLPLMPIEGRSKTVLFDVGYFSKERRRADLSADILREQPTEPTTLPTSHIPFCALPLLTRLLAV